MVYRTRIYYTQAQKQVMWDRWQQGDSLHTIARLFNRGHSSVRRILAQTGGIRPPQRKRSRLALSLSEREEISRGLARKVSLRSIAKQLQRAPPPSVAKSNAMADFINTAQTRQIALRGIEGAVLKRVNSQGTKTCVMP